MIVIRFLQFLFALLVVRLVSRLLGSYLGQQRRTPGARPAARPKVAGGELVRDRICNTHLPRDRALVARIGGRDEYFCSAACRDEALAALSRAS
jgi:hypothetical protein